jgi:hypothetical protein
MRALHLVWLVPFAALLMIGGAAIGLQNWCGDDLLGCPAGSGQAVSTLLQGIAIAIVVALAVTALFGAVPWTASRTRRRGVGGIVAIGYLVVVAVYLIVVAITG